MGTPTMSLKLRCPACKNVFDAGNAQPGVIVNCPGCKAAIRVPAAARVTPQPAAAKTSPVQSPATQGKNSNSSAKDVGTWGIPGVAIIGVLFTIFRKAGWISETTTRDQFMFEVFKFGLIAAVIGFAVWGIIELIRKALATPQVTPVSLPPPPPPPFASPPTASSADQWWLQLHGHTTGPFTTAAIIEAVRLGDFATTTPACPVGGKEWKPISCWPAFALTAPSNPTQSAR